MLHHSTGTACTSTATTAAVAAAAAARSITEQQQEQEEQQQQQQLLLDARRQKCDRQQKSHNQDVLSVSLPERRSGSTKSAPSLQHYVPLKSCLSHDNLGKLLLLESSVNSTNNNSTNSTSNNNNTMKKAVSFHRIDIREHRRALGDSPSVSQGPALALGWESADRGSFALDDYERYRPPRRTKAELAVPAPVREAMLRQQGGVSRGEMAAANRERERLRRGGNGALQPLRAIQKILHHRGESSKNAETQRQVEELLEQSRKVEQIREQQRQAYLAQLMEQLKVQQQDEETKLEQFPGQSTQEEDKKPAPAGSPLTTTTTTTMEEEHHDFKMVLRKDRKPSFLPNHGDDDDIHDGQVSDEDEHTDVLEF